MKKNLAVANRNIVAAVAVVALVSAVANSHLNSNMVMSYLLLRMKNLWS